MQDRNWSKVTMGSIVVVWCLAATGCKPSKQEIDALIDQRLVERGLVATPADAGSSAAPKSAPPNAPNAPAAASLAFLARLDELMKDYSPAPPVDNSDVLRCVTSAALKTTPELQKVSSELNAAKKRTAEFARAAYPLAFHYDPNWQSRESVMRRYACWDPMWPGGPNWAWEYNKADCSSRLRGQWKVQSEKREFVYSGSERPPTVAQRPELMTRMEVAGIALPSSFTCRVGDVVAGREYSSVVCVPSGGVMASVRVAGELRPMNIGDLISVPLAGVKRDPDGVLFKDFASDDRKWIVDADAASVKVDAAAACPSLAEIVASVAAK